MKRVIDITVACLFVVATVSLMFVLDRMIFGRIVAYVILGIQVMAGLWMIYEYIRAPIINDVEDMYEIEDLKKVISVDEVSKQE